MGMTDKQFDNHIRELIFALELALKENPDSEILPAMIRRYQATLES